MSNRYEYPQINIAGEVTNDTGVLELVAPDINKYTYIEKLVISVYEPASGGGKFRLQDSDGNPIYTINADGVRDIPLDFGEEGLKVSDSVDMGLVAIVYGAQIKQASVSVALTGHSAFK